MRRSDLAEQPTILVVDDDLALARMLVQLLEGRGYRVYRADRATEATDLMARLRPDLVILDVLLPDGDGLVLCSTLKAIHPAPIIMCSAVDRPRERILSLKLGADDFVAKPFDPDELEARVEVVLRRARRPSADHAPGPGGAIRVGALMVDEARHEVTLGGEPIHPSPAEFRLLLALARRPGEVVSREELARAVWGWSEAARERRLEVHLHRLRAKLHGARVAGPTIATIYGVGYRLAAGPRPAAYPPAHPAA